MWRYTYNVYKKKKVMYKYLFVIVIKHFKIIICYGCFICYELYYIIYKLVTIYDQIYLYTYSA